MCFQSVPLIFLSSVYSRSHATTFHTPFNSIHVNNCQASLALLANLCTEWCTCKHGSRHKLMYRQCTSLCPPLFSVNYIYIQTIFVLPKRFYRTFYCVIPFRAFSHCLQIINSLPFWAEHPENWGVAALLVVFAQEVGQLLYPSCASTGSCTYLGSYWSSSVPECVPCTWLTFSLRSATEQNRKTPHQTVVTEKSNCCQPFLHSAVVHLQSGKGKSQSLHNP